MATPISQKNIALVLPRKHPSYATDRDLKALYWLICVKGAKFKF